MGINNILAVAATCEQNNSKIVSKSCKMYGFWLWAATKGLWVIGYCGLMGFGAQIPIHRVGGMVLLWYSRGYGLSKVWFTRGSTVHLLSIVRRVVQAVMRLDVKHATVVMQQAADDVDQAKRL